MKFVKLCMIIGLVASGTVYGDSKAVYSSAEIEKKNEETEAILQRIKELESAEQKLILLIERKKDRQHRLTIQLRSIRECLKKDRALLGLPHDEPGKNWTKIILASTGVLMLTAATGGLAGGGIALLLKGGSACAAIQVGGAAGGIVGAHGVGKSLYKTGDVDFDEVAIEAIPRAALVGGAAGTTYAVATGVLNGFDGGIGGAVAAYIKSKSDKSNITPQKIITKNTPDTIVPDFVHQVKQNLDSACEAA